MQAAKLRKGMRVRCKFQPPAQLAGHVGTLVRSIQRGKQWLIQMDAGQVFDTPIGKSDCVWLWTCDFEPIQQKGVSLAQFAGDRVADIDEPPSRIWLGRNWIKRHPELAQRRPGLIEYKRN